MCICAESATVAMASLRTAEEFLQAIEEGDIEPPELMSWKRWMAYRKLEGRRPATRRGDAATNTAKEEAAVWRGVMEGFHGPDWHVELRAENRDAGLAGSGLPSRRGRQPG